MDRGCLPSVRYGKRLGSCQRLHLLDEIGHARQRGTFFPILIAYNMFPEDVYVEWLFPIFHGNNEKVDGCIVVLSQILRFTADYLEEQRQKGNHPQNR